MSGELLRVFDIGRVEGDLEVDLDARRARRHGDVFIGFVKHGRYLGTHAYVVGDEGRVILSFPWVDKVNWLLAFGATDELPVAVGDQGWEDLEQGWWASAIVRRNDVYLAETDLDRIIDEVRDAGRIEYLEPGTVLVDGGRSRGTSSAARRTTPRGGARSGRAAASSPRPSAWWTAGCSRSPDAVAASP